MDRVEMTKSLLEAVRGVTLAHGKYLSSQREYLNGENLYMREAHFVIAVGTGEPPTMSELAEKLDVTPGAVSQLAARMEKKGYIRRLTLAEDKRVNIVTLTPKGQELFREHQRFDAEHYRQLSDLFSDYTPEQLALIKGFERRLSVAFEELFRTPMT